MSTKIALTITAVAIVVGMSGIVMGLPSIPQVFAQQDPNSHGLEVSGVAERHNEEVSVPAHLAGRLPGGGCIVDEVARLQGEDVSVVARDLEIDTTD